MSKLALLFLLSLGSLFASTSANQVIQMTVNIPQNTQVTTTQPVITPPASSGLAQGLPGSYAFSSSIEFVSVSDVPQKIVSNLSLNLPPNASLTVVAIGQGTGASTGEVVLSSDGQNVLTDIAPRSEAVVSLEFTLTLGSQVPPGSYTRIIYYTMLNN